MIIVICDVLSWLIGSDIGFYWEIWTTEPSGVDMRLEMVYWVEGLVMKNGKSTGGERTN